MKAISINPMRKPLIVALLMSGVAIGTSTFLVSSSRAEKSEHAHEAVPVIMTPSDLKWTPSPALAEGLTVSLLYGDMSKPEPVGFRIKLPKGGMLAPHTHPVHERVTVISGTFAMGEGTKFDKSVLRDMPTGSVAIFPTGCPMFGYAQEETVIQVNAEGPWGITYINPEDDPRKRERPISKPE
jgi:quercetin dioxygenase-like cupin family protein